MTMNQDASLTRIASYRAAMERLAEARQSALEKRLPTQAPADVVAGQEALNQLKLALKEFKETRNGLGLDSRELFITRFNIEVITKGRVSLVLPAGVTRSDMLKEAQAIALEHYDKAIIHAIQMHFWCGNERFTESSNAPSRIEIQGIVRGSENKNVTDQRRFLAKQGFTLPETRDLIIAHAAHIVATGESMISDFVIRASDGSVRYYPFGLEEDSSWGKDLPFAFVAAAGSPVPPRKSWRAFFRNL